MKMKMLFLPKEIQKKYAHTSHKTSVDATAFEH
jgi:hypothetical protein